ncbi:hypothetical protein [Methyloversatilis sp.]|uniref:hypothetical protein n=1 Tax=Methyloversatilis sp. TaxID=2569862 RepID=UPI0035B31AB3
MSEYREECIRRKEVQIGQKDARPVKYGAKKRQKGPWVVKSMWGRAGNKWAQRKPYRDFRCETKEEAEAWLARMARKHHVEPLIVNDYDLALLRLQQATHYIHVYWIEYEGKS